MAKENDPVLTGEFVKTPTVLLTDKQLTDAEVRLWLVLAAHCMKGDSCYPSTKRLAALLGKSPTWVKTLILALEQKGFLGREYRRGKVALYRPKTPDDRSTPLDHLMNEGGQPHLTTPVNSTCPQWSTPLDREVDKRTRIKKQSTGPSVRGGRESKPKKPTDPNIKPLLDAFCSVYQEKIGAKYSVSGARDGAIIKSLLTDHSPEILKRCIDAFFADRDPWLDDKRTVPVFRSRINQYVQRSTAAKTSEPPRPTQSLRDVSY